MADGVTVPFQPQSKISKDKILWREVKVALFARLGRHQTKAGKIVARLHRRRFFAVLGTVDDLKPRLQLEAKLQSIETASQLSFNKSGITWINERFDPLFGE